MGSLADRVGDALSAIGLVVALVTLYTGELARRRSEAGATQGKADAEFPSIRYQTVALLIVTSVALVGVWPLIWDTATTMFDSTTISPTLWLFGVIWLLLNALAVWQASIVGRTITYAEDKKFIPLAVLGLLAVLDATLLVRGIISTG